MKKVNLKELAKGHKFSKGSIVEALVKSENPNEKDLAAALKKTKAYKENAELKEAVGNVLSGKTEVNSEPKPEKKQVPDVAASPANSNCQIMRDR